jgi:hypothetical protein
MQLNFIIEPGTYQAFENEEDQLNKCKDWGLLSEKAARTKAFTYKGNGVSLSCTIVGYIDDMTAVIALDNQQLHCIHPSYLKEMQAASFGQRNAAAASESASEQEEPALETGTEIEAAAPTPAPAAPAPAPELTQSTAAQAEEKPKAAPKKERAPKLQLPEEKVKMTATVAEFTTVPNHFADTDDEVVIYESVKLVDTDTDVGSAWSSHSATLKKLELAVGDTLSFEAKIAAKKLTKHPVPYKINNPSKLVKLEP